MSFDMSDEAVDRRDAAHRKRLLEIARDDWKARAEQAEAKVAALEARLAEVAPVVEAAEAYENVSRESTVQTEIDNARWEVRKAIHVYRNARAKREDRA